MKKTILALFVFMLAVACNDDDQAILTCDANTISNTDWFVDLVEDIEDSTFRSKYFYYTKAIYQQQDVIIFRSCCPFCRIAPAVYNCNGEQLTDIQYNSFTNEILLWKSEMNECG